MQAVSDRGDFEIIFEFVGGPWMRNLKKQLMSSKFKCKRQSKKSNNDNYNINCNNNELK